MLVKIKIKIIESCNEAMMHEVVRNIIFIDFDDAKCFA